MTAQGFADVLIGTQYGDEGKARVADGKAKEYDVIARFNGGANAGHTIVHDGKSIALHQVPSGIFYKNTSMYIGSGCVINISKLDEELENLKKSGIDARERLHISSQASVIQPHHLAIDANIGSTIGTTKNGIGPAYADRALRMWGERVLNIRMGDLQNDPDTYFRMMRANFEAMAALHGYTADIDSELAEMKKDFEAIAPLIEKDTLFLQKKVMGGAKVLFEGAQAFMLDVVKGLVPYVTSSGTTAAAAYGGGDLSPDCHRKTIGVAKVIMSRVGHGPFPSEFGGMQSEEYCMKANADGSPMYGKAVEAAYDVDALLASSDPFDVGKAIRVLSGEYGTTTTRPRRIGVFDLVQLSHAVKINGIKSLVLTKCDLLQAYSRTKNGMIPLVTGYELDGEMIDYVPASLNAYQRVKPIIEYREGFTEDIKNAKNPSDLPSALKKVLKEIEERAGCAVEGIGVGSDREEYVTL